MVDKSHETGLEPKILDVDYAAVSTLRKAGHKFYLSIHAPDVEFWDLEPNDRVLVKLVKVKKAKDVKELGLR